MDDIVKYVDAFNDRNSFWFTLGMLGLVGPLPLLRLEQSDTNIFKKGRINNDTR